MTTRLGVVIAVLVVGAPCPLSGQSFDDLIRLGRAQLDSGKADNAVKSFEKAVKLDAKSSDAHLWLARAVGTVAQKANIVRQPFLAKRSKSEFEKAVELDPNSIGGREGMLQFYLFAPGVMGGSVSKARGEAAALAKISALRGRFAEATIALHEKDVAGAEKAYRAAATEFPDSLNATTTLTNFLINRERAEEAFGPLERYLERKPDDRVALYYFGRAAGITGKQLDRGEQALRTVLATPDAPNTRIAPENAHFGLGEIAAKRGDKDAARAAYQEALRLNPRYERAKKALAAI